MAHSSEPACLSELAIARQVHVNAMRAAMSRGTHVPAQAIEVLADIVFKWQVEYAA